MNKHTQLLMLLSKIQNRAGLLLPLVTLMISIFIFVGLYFKFYQNFISDDVFIFLCNANNIAQNGKYACNGEINYSSTSFIYPFLIAGIQNIILINSIYAARIISILFFALSILFIYGHLLKTQGKDISIYGVSLFLANPFMLRWFSTGMESTFVGFVLLVIYFLNYRAKHVMTALFSGALILIRPEFIVIGPIIIILSNLTIRKKIMLFSLWSITLAIAILVIFQITNQLLPNSFYGKVYKSEFFNIHTLFLNAGTLFFATFAMFFVTFMYIINYGIRSNLKKIWGHLVLILVFLLYTLKSKLFLSRYFLFYIPVLIVEALSVKILPQVRSIFIFGAVIFSIITNLVLTFFYVGPSSQNFANNFQTIYHSLSIDFNKNESSAPLKIWATDVGILSLYSKKYIVCDPVGLVDKRRFDFKSDIDYFNHCKPDFIITRDDDLTPEIKNIVSEQYKFFDEYNLGSLGVLDSKERVLKILIKNENF